MSEQKTATATDTIPSDAWGHPISEERQAELQGYLDQWQAETVQGKRKGPFARDPQAPFARVQIRLTGADVYWLAERSRHDDSGVPNLHLEEAYIGEAHLENADLSYSHLENADLSYSHLENADLSHSYLARAALREAHLEGSNLYLVHLEDADLTKAYLQGANLYRAHLEGADLFGAHLDSTDLRRVWLDSTTIFYKTTLNAKTCLGDIQWSGVGAVNLTSLNWNILPVLGDEQSVTARSPVNDHEKAVRAYRQLAAQLRAQGLSEAADRFSERAQIRQRKLLFRQFLADWRRPWHLPGDVLRWLFSWFLALLAGYGYHPGRTLLWYLAVISGFAFAYGLATHGILTFGLHPSQVPPLHWYEALVLSISAFHGRGFFQPVQSLGDPVAILAAAEAIIGLLIEISFIATFTQRFFGNK